MFGPLMKQQCGHVRDPSDFYLFISFTTGVTVIDKPLWLLLTPAADSEQSVFCWILILDLSMMPMLQCWAALAQALTKTKIMTRLLLLRMMKIFALTWNGGAVTNERIKTCVVSPSWQDCSSDWTNQSEAPLCHCSATETLLIWSY